MTISIDPEFKSLIPPLTDKEFSGLEASILEEGRARVPLAVWNGILLDGHSRYTICQRHNLPFTTQEVGNSDWTRTDAKIWIIRNQLSQRNLTLTPYARVELALKLKPFFAEKAAKNKAEAVAASNRARAKARKTQPIADGRSVMGRMRVAPDRSNVVNVNTRREARLL